MNNIPAITELKELAPIGFWGVVVIILVAGFILWFMRTDEPNGW
jgi:hypothetical protein